YPLQPAGFVSKQFFSFLPCKNDRQPAQQLREKRRSEISRFEIFCSFQRDFYDLMNGRRKKTG
ncbi:hypothetical protein, partial [Escherichia coli]|uniref:hypothetical protein n=1 Tax=Escherichia coli TaxID=562 RepID=UPI001F5A7ED4